MIRILGMDWIAVFYPIYLVPYHSVIMLDLTRHVKNCEFAVFATRKCDYQHFVFEKM